MIPGFIISWLTFPGVFIHEVAHELFCVLTGTRVLRVCYFRFGVPSGFVEHEKPSSVWKSILIGVGPLIVNTGLGLAIGILAIPYRTPGIGEDFIFPVLMWLAISVAMHSFPSPGDAKTIWAAITSKPDLFFPSVHWAHPGTIANTVTYETGPGGVTNLSLTLDGTGHIDLGQVADFDFTGGSGTVEGWIRPNWSNPASYDPCVFADRDGAGSVWSVHVSRWKTEIVNFSSGAQSLAINSDNAWHHYAIVFDDGAVSMYWDGQPRGGFFQTINSFLAKTTQIGSSAPTTTSEGWMGGLDEVAFYSAALGADAIWNHYLAMVGPPSLSYSLAGTQLTLSWPADVTGFVLEYAVSLPATSWIPVSGVVNSQVTVDASAGMRFFRLRK